MPCSVFIQSSYVLKNLRTSVFYSHLYPASLPPQPHKEKNWIIHKQRMKMRWQQSRFALCREGPCAMVGRWAEGSGSSRTVEWQEGHEVSWRQGVNTPTTGTSEARAGTLALGAPVTWTLSLLLCLLLLCPPCLLPALPSSWGASCSM